jgi:hypothetical protein
MHVGGTSSPTRKKLLSVATIQSDCFVHDPLCLELLIVFTQE